MVGSPQVGVELVLKSEQMEGKKAIETVLLLLYIGLAFTPYVSITRLAHI